MWRCWNRRKHCYSGYRVSDRWLALPEIAAMLKLSERSIKALQKRGFPLRRVSPRSRPGALESELAVWMKRQRPDGKPLRGKA